MKNGEDIITKVSETRDIRYMLFTDPMRLTYLSSPAKPGMVIVSMNEWVYPKICTVREFLVPTDEVLFTGEVSPEMLSYYESSITDDDDVSIHHDDDILDMSDDSEQPEQPDVADKPVKVIKKLDPEVEKKIADANRIYAALGHKKRTVN